MRRIAAGIFERRPCAFDQQPVLRIGEGGDPGSAFHRANHFWSDLGHRALEKLCSSSFGVTVAGDEVSRGKPHPESYLTAARLLGADPAASVVLEDSPPGAAAGNAAGAVVVAIPQHVPMPEAPRRVLVASLAELTVDDLRRLVARANDEVGG